MKYITAILLFVLVSCSESKPEPESTIDSSAVQLYWWDSLISDNKAVRIEAMNKYLEVRKKAESAKEFENGELISGYLKTFFSTHPSDFLDVYSTMKDEQQKELCEDIASTFQASGDDYKNDLDEYFTNIQNSCNDCSTEQKKLLMDLQQQIESEAKKTNEKLSLSS
jgi:hypothetical protein